MALQTILRGKKEFGLQKQVQTGLFVLLSGYGVDEGLGSLLEFLGVGGCTMHRLHTSMILSSKRTCYRHTIPISILTLLQCPTMPLSMSEYNFPT